MTPTSYLLTLGGIAFLAVLFLASYVHPNAGLLCGAGWLAGAVSAVLSARLGRR